MKSVVLVGMLTLALSGCSIISPKIAPTVAKGVNRYCEEPQASRMLVREEVNNMVKPHSIQVNCFGDQ
jgi:uncharacterized protein YceK